MEKRWLLKPTPDKDFVKAISEKLNTSFVTSTLIVQRGINSLEDAKEFFRPSLENLHDPFLMKEMHIAVERVIKAINSKEKIMIYGDYDVDGTTSVSMLYHFAKYQLNAEAIYYIPDRYKEGYGLSKTGIEYAKDEGIGLIITLDCGIRAIENVAYANSLGIDTIICDHHEPGEELPDAAAILNPKLKDCKYPYKELSGCGVGFKLIQALAHNLQIKKETTYEYLDLLAISIAADIVPIDGENRILMYFGLKVINSKPRLGVASLMDSCGFKEGKSLNTANIVFGLAPRINAAGRLEHAHRAVELLISSDTHQAKKLAISLNKINDDRKVIDGDITDEAINLIKEGDLNDKKTTVLYNEKWHKGVIGIVASRCIEKYYRPTIILTYSEGMVTGSVRSIPGYNVYEALCQCSELLEKYGGHKYAAGLTLRLENLPQFIEKFESVVSDSIPPDIMIPAQKIDLNINLEDINTKMLSIINQMAPFGPGNMSPIFSTENLIVEKYTILNDLHIKMTVYQKNNTWKRITFDAIGFNMSEYEKYISENKPFKLAYKIEENNFMGNTSIQLHIKDIKPQEKILETARIDL